MKRILLGLCAAVAVLALVLLTTTGSAPLKAVVGSGLFALVALIAGAAGFACGLVALRTARRLRQDVDRLAHSLDGALKTLANIGSRNTSTIEELTDAVNRDIGRLSERLDRADGDRPAAAATGGDNVVALPMSARRQRNPAPTSQDIASPAPTMVPAGPIEIHLEPIVSVGDSAARGFEAYAGVRLANGDEHVTRRLSDLVPVKERIRFEFALFEAVVTASRRQLGSNARDIPIHVAISRAFIEDPASSARVLELFKLHPGLEGQIILSLPEAPASTSTAFAKTVARLAQAGAHFALEAAPETDGAVANMVSAGIIYLKLSANRLLDRERGRLIRPGSDIAHEAGAANISVIASGVATDEDVLALMDLGVDLMAGPRFSAPRRLKSTMPDSSSAAQGG